MSVEESKQRDLLKSLMEKKTEMETKIKELNESLNSSGFGLRGGLVDKDGFPLNDFDKVVAVRTSRHDLAVLQNDHKDLMKQIEKELFALHAILKQNEGSNPTTSTSPTTSATPSVSQQTPVNTQKHENTVSETKSQTQTQTPTTQTTKSYEPFAKIDDVSPNGPSFHSGLKVGDLLLKFGNVVKENNNNLKALSGVTLQNEGKSIEVIVKRGEQILELKLTPQKWSGKGLLGCHLVPYSGK